MPDVEHEWSSKEYAQEWAAKDKARAAEREAQLQAAVKWLSVSVEGRARVMDLGSGSGTVAQRLLASFPEMEVICVDASEPMLAMARERLAMFAQRVSFFQSDLSQQGWTAALPKELDAVVSARAIHNLRKLKPIEKVYCGVCDLLRPGGVFFNIERVNFSTPTLRNYYRQLRKSETGRLPQLDGPAPSLLQQFHLLKRARFRHIDCFWREGNTAIVGGFKKLEPSS